MNIGLIDVDSHNFPNLALMKLSAYHKAKGDAIDWWWGWEHYDTVYMSKVFSAAYSADHYMPVNADQIVCGGSGYAISTISGLEVYDQEHDPSLPPEIDHIYSDYGLYPELTNGKAFGRLTAGCPQQCPWYHVHRMQGIESRHIADLSEFWHEQRKIILMDANLLACSDRETLLLQLVQSHAAINFNQGLDIRRMDDDVIDLVNQMSISRLYFAWDDPMMDLTNQFSHVGERLRVKRIASRAVYVLTNFRGSTVEDTLERIYILRSLRFDPYVMVYNKPAAPEKVRQLQSWCNNKIIFNAQPDFYKFNGRK